MEPESEEDKNVEKGETVAMLWMSSSWASSSDIYDLEEINELKGNIDQIVENFSEGDKVKVQYDENFVLGSLIKYPQEWTIWEHGIIIVKEE